MTIKAPFASKRSRDRETAAARPAEAGRAPFTSAYRPLLKAMYLVFALLLLYSLSEPLFQIWPFRMADARWRFGAAGLLSAAMDTAVLATGLLMLVAALLRHRRTLRTFGVLCIVTAVVLMAVAVMFGLDFLQIRATVNPRVRGALDVTVMRAMLLLVLSIPTLLFLGLAAWRSTRKSAHTAGGSALGPGLIYRSQTEGAQPTAAGGSAVAQSPRKEEEEE